MINVYSDGAYSSSRSQMGWCFIIDTIPRVRKFGGLVNSTNNRGEIYACLKALEYIKSQTLETQITIYTDSMYVIGAMSKGNKRNKNNDLLDIMDELVKGLEVTWTHVKGHENNELNNECDKFAVFGSQIDGCENDKI